MKTNNHNSSNLFRLKVDLGDGILYKVKEKEQCQGSTNLGQPWGIYDSIMDMVIIPCIYEAIIYFRKKEIFIVKYYNEWKRSYEIFAVNRNNKIVIPSEYKSISIVDDTYIKVSTDGTQMGIVNCNGNIIVPPIYENIWPSETGFMVSKTINGKNKCGFVNKNGHTHLEYDLFAIVSNTPSDLCHDEFGNSYTPTPDTHYSEVTFSDDNHLYSHVELIEADELSEQEESDIYEESHIDEKTYIKPKYFIVAKEGKYGVIDENNHIMVPMSYQNVIPVLGEDLNPAFYIIQQNNLYGLCDLYGNICLPIEYKSIHSHNECTYKKNGIGIYACPTPIIGIDGSICEGTKIPPKGKTVYFEVELMDETHMRLLSSGKPYLENSISTDTSVSYPIFSKGFLQNDNSMVIHRYLFFDTETTGLPENYDAPSSKINNWPRLVQLSWILTDASYDIISQQDHIVYPDGFVIPEDALRIHGITTSIAKERGEGINVVLQEFINDFRKATCIVGHNISYDKKIVGAELIRLGIRDSMNDIKTIDTMKSSVNFCKIPGKFGYKWPKLQELHKALFGYEFVNAHNSMSDVHATLKCFVELKHRKIL